MIQISKYKLRFKIDDLQQSNIFNQDDIQQLYLNLLVSRDIIIYTDEILTKKRWWVICHMISYDHWKDYDWIRQTNELAMKSSNPKVRSSFRFLHIDIE